MKLISQTVYIPTLERSALFEISSFGEDDWTIPETNANKKEGYFLSKEELIELLDNAWKELVETPHPFSYNKEKFINNLLNQQ